MRTRRRVRISRRLLVGTNGSNNTENNANNRYNSGHDQYDHGN